MFSHKQLSMASMPPIRILENHEFVVFSKNPKYTAHMKSGISDSLFEDPYYLKHHATFPDGCCAARCRITPGKSEDMEDFFYHNPEEQIFIMCDGHGGDQTSKWIIKKLPLIIKELQQTKRCTKETLLSTAILSLKIELDKLAPSKIGEMGFNNGSTITVSVVIEEQGQRFLTTAYLGDSPAMIAKIYPETHEVKSFLELTHEPTLCDLPLQDKLKSLGAEIIKDRGGIPRLNGHINMAHAFGDYFIHFAVKTSKEGKIVLKAVQKDLVPGIRSSMHEPTTTILKLEEGETYRLIQMTDGVPPSLCPTPLDDAIATMHAITGRKAQAAANNLVSLAYEFYQKDLIPDNSTALVVDL